MDLHSWTRKGMTRHYILIWAGRHDAKQLYGSLERAY